MLLEFYAIEFCQSAMKTSNSEILGTKGQAPDVIYENVWLFESTYRASRTCVKNKNSKYLILDHGYFWVLKITLDSSKIIILIFSRTINFCCLERDINLFLNEAGISNFPFHKNTRVSLYRKLTNIISLILNRTKTLNISYPVSTFRSRNYKIFKINVIKKL